ncbi:MAG TPA: molybdopterin molybdotransferase MoeA [Ohtaekwangia sp.]|nr:molybdopterin molybdotransferase MoeA [Ohtaekwangia sp.]
MVSVEEATRIVLSNLYKPAVVKVALSDAGGRVLAADVEADRDFPPFDRVAMDGIAIRFEDLSNGNRRFTVKGVQRAGRPFEKLTGKRHAMEVMTGAILPENADTVIRYEDLAIAGDSATVTIDTVQAGQNVHRKGQDAARGEKLLEPGILLSAAEVALLASVGMSEVPVMTFPSAAIISTGDELVPVNDKPLVHQIRRSNTYAVQAGMRAIGWQGEQFHLEDNKDHIVTSLRKIAADHDVMIISGGVSKGKFDFIPEALEAIGVQKLFHQVQQRPGKPFWFGVSTNGKIVFALPGNPVSTYMCFYRFVLPWLWKSLGVEQQPSYASLAADYTFQPNLTNFLQVRIANENGRLRAYPDAGGGSGDFANLKNIDGFLELPAGKNRFEAGEIFTYIPFRIH